MQKISTGIKDLVKLIDSAHIVDNIEWEVEAGASEDVVFMYNFISNSLSENKDVIYVSFNKYLQGILLNINIYRNLEKLTILDCFTSGKGKNDNTFLKFYETKHSQHPNVIKVSSPGDIPYFSERRSNIGCLYMKK